MKLLSILLLMFIYACDAPQRTRFPTQGSGSVYNGYSQGDEESGYDGYDQGDDENGGDQGTTTTSGQQGNNSEPGYENCNDSTPYYGGSIGYFGLCAHSDDERKYKARFSSSDLTVGACFVPIHILDGKSFKVGIAECVHNNKDTNYYMTLNKQRPEAINGVMVLRANAVNSYMQCMNAKANYIAGHPGCEYNAGCLAQADQYAYSVCNSFVQQYSNDYKQVQF